MLINFLMFNVQWFIRQTAQAGYIKELYKITKFSYNKPYKRAMYKSRALMSAPTLHDETDRDKKRETLLCRRVAMRNFVCGESRLSRWVWDVAYVPFHLRRFLCAARRPKLLHSARVSLVIPCPSIAQKGWPKGFSVILRKKKYF